MAYKKISYNRNSVGYEVERGTWLKSFYRCKRRVTN